MVFVFQLGEPGNGESHVSNGTFPPESSIVGATHVLYVYVGVLGVGACVTTDGWCLSCRNANLKEADMR
jgi:hypothetical protein